MVNYKNYVTLDNAAKRLAMTVREWMNSLDLMDKTIRAVNPDLSDRLSEWHLDLCLCLHLYFWNNEGEKIEYVISMADRG